MTQTVLHIDASARRDQSRSRAMTTDIVARLGAGRVITRDLAHSLPHIDEEWVGATFTPPDERSPAQVDKLALSDQLVDELEAADVIVIGLPIYNFGMPAALKAWIDQVGRVGRTFRYTKNGPVGLLAPKPVIVAVASGGTKLGSEADFITEYLQFVLGFLGLSDVTIIPVADGADEKITIFEQLGLPTTQNQLAA